MIRFTQVKKRFDDKIVLDGVSFCVAKGEIAFVIGKSGAGKSVLLKSIVGLLRVDEGEVWVDEQEVSQFSENQFFGVRKKCGMVFQHPALLDSMTLYENIAFGLRAHRLLSTEREIRERVLKKLALVHLGPSILKRYPPELSFGMQKRASIARVLVSEPDYLLFDEPTTAQDPVMTRSINQLIRGLSEQLNVTSIVVSHDMHCALEIANRILLLNEGKLLADGDPEALLQSKEPIVQAFLAEGRERR